MKKIIPVILILFSCMLFAIDVDRDELLSVSKGGVEFYNYVGPHAVIDTKEQIINIGYVLGSGLRSGDISRFFSKYTIKHFEKEESYPLLNGDLFILEPSAGVDHIRNLRWIIAGYLEAAYGYSFEDALVLAEFSTYYNVVHRNDLTYVQQKFIEELAKNTNLEKIGLSTRYDEWAGLSEILIPLTSSGTGRIDTESLSEDEVIETLQDEEDKGIDVRKDMIDIREQENEQDQEQIDQERTQLEQEENKLRDEESQLKDELQNTLEDKEQAETDQEREQAEQKEQDLQQQLSENEKAQQDLVEKKEDLNDEQEKVDQRQENIQEERQSIAEDEQALIEDAEKEEQERAEVAAAQPERETETETLPFLTVDNNGENRQLILVDTLDGKIDSTSQLQDIHSSELYMINGAILLIAGEKGSNTAVRLVLVDMESLEVEIQSEVDIFSGSHILLDDDTIYCVADSNGSYMVASFDTDLKQTGISDIEVNPFTLIINQGSDLYVQDSDNDIIILDKEDLTKIAE